MTTFGPGPTDKFPIDPSRVYSGCFFEFNGGHVYVTNPTTAASFRPRDVRSSDTSCTTAANATDLANAYLSRCNTEEERFTANIDAVPAAAVNLVRPGQRIPLRLSHVPGFTAWGNYMTVTKRSVSPLTNGMYKLTLELADPVLTGFWPAGILSPSLWAVVGTVTRPVRDITTVVLGQTVPPMIVGTGDGVTELFIVPTRYLPGSLKVWVDDQLVDAGSVAETDPNAGTFTLDFAPLGVSGSIAAETITASWQVG